MKYSPDSYLLYGTAKTPRPAFPIRVRITMADSVKSDVLERAAQRAIRRYPYFAVRVALDADGGFVLQPNDSPIVVCATRAKTFNFGSEAVNGHLAFIDYEGCDIYFNIHHTLTGAMGMYEWVKTTLYEYVSEAYGVQPDATGILLADSPLLPGETDFPDVASLTSRIPDIWFTRADDAHHFVKDYFLGALCPFFTPQYYTFEIEQSDVLAYAKKHGGSPVSVIVALTFKAVCNMLPKKFETILAAVTHNYREEVGCPNTYHDLVQPLYVRYSRDMASRPVSELCAFALKAIREQMTPENAAAELRRVVHECEVTDSLPTLAEKRKYNLTHSRYSGQPRGTFTVSYLGRTKWGGLEPYIRSAYTLAEGHLNLEIVNVGTKFCLSFFLVTPGHRYLRCFREILDEEGIAYTLHGPFKKNLPGIELPQQGK